MLKNADAQTSPDLGALMSFGLPLVAITLIGFASGTVLLSFSSLRQPKNWGSTLIVAGIIAPGVRVPLMGGSNWTPLNRTFERRV